MMDIQVVLAKLSQPAQRALQEAGITTLEELARHTEKEIAALHGMGPKGIRIIREVLIEHGLNFAPRK